MVDTKWMLVNLLYISFMQLYMCVDVVSYSRRINFNSSDISYFNVFASKSLDACVDECSRRTSCEFVNYNIRSRTCYLGGPYSSYNMIEDQKYISVVMNGSNANGASPCTSCGPQMMCADDGVICIKEVCGPAPTIEYATKTGNLRSIGSQVVYLCMYGSTMRVVSRCKADATWSPVALYCPPPPTTLEPTTTVDPSSETWFLCEDILFAITEIKYTWYEGKIHCQSFGGRFAEVTSLSIGTCLADTYEADYRSNTLWIGASDLDSDGVLEWTTGNEADSQGFGLSNSVEGKCIYLDTASREWRVDGCDVDNKVVCQR